MTRTSTFHRLLGLLILTGLVPGLPAPLLAQTAAALRGVEAIGVTTTARIEAGLFERVDEAYLRELVAWQLDQYRVQVEPRRPSRPFLLVEIEVEQITGPALLKGEDEEREVEGIYRARAEVSFHQQVRTRDNPSYEFWAATYRRSEEGFAESREEMESEVIRLLENSLLSFIRTFRRANGVRR
ncbi:MAG TPA: hypothetical protein VLV83_02895 [Acidobacteriota bacterium]|nr:hypothetical protein [Acidobacteriota bacterium]